MRRKTITKNRKIITKKTLVLIVAALVLLTSLFAGCSQSKTSKPAGKTDSAAETTTAGTAVNEKLTVSEEEEDGADGVQSTTKVQGTNGKGGKTSSKFESTTSKSTNGSGNSGNGKADKAETTKAPSTTESSTKQNGSSPNETTTLNEQDGEWGEPVKN